MSLEIVHGYILKIISYGESDIIAHLFTKEYGKIGVFVKSYKKSKKRYQGTIDRYLYNEFEVDIKENKLSILKNSKIIDPLINLRNDPSKLIYAEHMSELFFNMLQAEKEEFEEFDRILHFIAMVDEMRYSHLLVIRFNILTQAGIMPFINNIEDLLYSSIDFKFDKINGSIRITEKQAKFLILYQNNNEELFNYDFDDYEKKIFGKIFSTLYYSITSKPLLTIELLKEFI